jgi:diguanylate cyclase (GGDEF)-like protein
MGADEQGGGATEREAELLRRIRELEAENRALHRELERERYRARHMEWLAERDPLTHLLNRRAFEQRLSQMIAYRQRYGDPGSLVYFDVDNLKTINDGYGHAAGDAVLMHVAKVLSQHTRESDVLARIGGDEFALLLQKSGYDLAARKARELVDRVYRTPARFEDEDMDVSLAAGVYAFEPEDTVESALKTVDNRMYGHKRGDRAID